MWGVGIYFVCLIVLIPYVVLNLFIAVVSSVYENRQSAVDTEMYFLTQGSSAHPT